MKSPSKLPKSIHKHKYGDLPVRDAKARIYVQPIAADFVGAKRENPEYCVYAQCLKRVYDSNFAVIWKRTALIKQKDEKGEPILMRYTLSTAARQFIETFDTGGSVSPKGFYFNPPPPSRMLDGQLVRDRKYKKSVKYKAAEKRRKEAKIKGIKATERKGPIIISPRSGAGMVHFVTGVVPEGIRSRRIASDPAI